MAGDYWYTMTDERAAEIAACEADLTPRIVISICCMQEWAEGDEHQRWIDTAPAAEVASWVLGIHQDELDAEE